LEYRHSIAVASQASRTFRPYVRLGSEQTVLDQLLSDRTAPLPDPPGPQVGPRGAQHPAHVKAAMFEEAMVLGREDSLYQHARRVGEAYRVILLPGSSRRAREDLRFENDAAERLAIAHDVTDALALELEDHARRAPLLIVFHPPDVQLPSIRRSAELSRRRDGRQHLRVLETPQGAGQIDRADVDARDQLLSSRVHQRRTPGLNSLKASQLDCGVRDRGHQTERKDNSEDKRHQPERPDATNTPEHDDGEREGPSPRAADIGKNGRRWNYLPSLTVPEGFGWSRRAPTQRAAYHSSSRLAMLTRFPVCLEWMKRPLPT